MNSKRFYLALIALIASTLLAIVGMAVLGNIVLKKQSTKLIEEKTEYASLEAQEISLNQAKKDIIKYAELNKLTKSIVPQDKDQAKTLREIYKIAADNGVPVKSIVFNNSTLGQKTVAPSASSGSGTTPTQQQTAPPITQAKPVEGITGVYTMEIILSNDSENLVSYNNIIRFLAALESNRRTAHISNIILTPDRKRNNELTYNITLKVYIKPEAKK